MVSTRGRVNATHVAKGLTRLHVVKLEFDGGGLVIDGGLIRFFGNEGRGLFLWLGGDSSGAIFLVLEIRAILVVGISETFAPGVVGIRVDRAWSIVFKATALVIRFLVLVTHLALVLGSFFSFLVYHFHGGCVPSKSEASHRESIA